jgi:hypothetical protein
MFKTSQGGRAHVKESVPSEEERQVTAVSSVATVCRASLATAGMLSGALSGIVTVGELSRTQRVVALGPSIPVESLRVSGFDYVLQTPEGQELLIPRWASLCVPPRDDLPQEASVTRERIVSEWPAYLPEILAWNPARMELGERYYIVLPEVMEQSD